MKKIISLRKIAAYLFLAFAVITNNRSAYSQNGTNASKPVSINVDFNKLVGDMYPMWAWFGYDEPNYTYMKDGKKLLSEIAALSPVPVYVRGHSLMVTGDGTPALKWGKHQYVQGRR